MKSTQNDLYPHINWHVRNALYEQAEVSALSKVLNSVLRVPANLVEMLTLTMLKERDSRVSIEFL